MYLNKRKIGLAQRKDGLIFPQGWSYFAGNVVYFVCNIHLALNKNINIIVGENESGKSTILEAIDIVINQRYRNIDKYIIKEILNSEEKKCFEKNPSVKNLPKVYIEIELYMDDYNISTKKYYGPVNLDNKNKFGLKFVCEIDDDYINDLLPYIKGGKIPYEYYKMGWTTFSGANYKIYKKNYNTILIDNSSMDPNSSFNYYNKSLFYAIHDIENRLKLKNKFREKMTNLFDEIGIGKLPEGEKRFGVNHRKIILENILAIYDGDIPIENKGKGMENIIKTGMALKKEETKIDTVLIEEPENHLSYSNLLEMIEDITLNSKDSQLIITTHESMIASRLDLKNIIWLSEKDKATKLNDIKDDTADFFMKADDNKFLQFLLAKKVILVEGATEYILIPEMYRNTYDSTIEEDNITVISCGAYPIKDIWILLKKLIKEFA